MTNPEIIMAAIRHYTPTVDEVMAAVREQAEHETCPGNESGVCRHECEYPDCELLKARGRMTAAEYHASDGSRWTLSHDFPPIPVRHYDWSATHEDYDGAPDAYDRRHVHAATAEEIPAAVEAFIEEQDA